MPLTLAEQDQVDQHIADKGVQRVAGPVGPDAVRRLFWSRRKGSDGTHARRRAFADDLAARDHIQEAS